MGPNCRTAGPSHMFYSDGSNRRTKPTSPFWCLPPHSKLTLDMATRLWVLGVATPRLRPARRCLELPVPGLWRSHWWSNRPALPAATVRPPAGNGHAVSCLRTSPPQCEGSSRVFQHTPNAPCPLWVVWCTRFFLVGSTPTLPGPSDIQS